MEKKIAPEVIAHRGGKQNWPENTVCAFRQNATQGIGTIELDVQVTQDGQVVVYHPDDLSQWTNSSGPISSRPAAEITELDTSVKYIGPDTYKTVCSAKDTKIPLLTDVLSDFPQTQFIIDMKSPETQRLVDALVAIIPAADWLRLRFYSTNPEHTKFLRQTRPNAAIFEDRSETLTRLLRIVFFGINTVEDYQRASELGANAVFSDNPSLLLLR